jgi:glycerate dehydrogenase
MKILILDGYTLFQEDIEWKILEQFGTVEYHHRISKNSINELDNDFDVIITNKALVGKEELSHFKNLQLIIVSATGYNCVDIKLCTERGIQVSNVPAYGTFSVAQHTLSLLLHLSNHIGLHDTSVKKGDWENSIDWTYTLAPIREWEGKTLGVIGMGNIGSCFAGMAESMGMKVIYHHTRDLQLPNRKFVDLDELASTSDVISLHCPLNEKTEKLINKNFLSKTKENVVILNTSRGGLIDAVDLRNYLLEHTSAAALLDVLEKEPPPVNHPLIGLPNATITPHIAWISIEARKRIFSTMIEILNFYKNGEPLNRVN